MRQYACKVQFHFAFKWKYLILLHKSIPLNILCTESTSRKLDTIQDTETSRTSQDIQYWHCSCNRIGTAGFHAKSCRPLESTVARVEETHAEARASRKYP